MLVKITKATLKSYWYSNKIGEVFDVEIWNRNSYHVINDPDSLIRFDDCVAVTEVATKPPIGLKPELIVLEQRQKEIQEAVTRYMEAGLEIPKEWTAEYYRNNTRLLEIK